MRTQAIRKGIPAVELNEGYLTVRRFAFGNEPIVYSMVFTNHYSDDPNAVGTNRNPRPHYFDRPYGRSFNVVHNTMHWGAADPVRDRNYLVILNDSPYPYESLYFRPFAFHP